MSSYYSDYADHMLRFYCRYPDKKSSWGAAEKQNWSVCHTVLHSLPEQDEKIIRQVYTTGTRGLSEAVNICAMRMGFSPSYAWKLIWEVRKAVAMGRKLI